MGRGIHTLALALAVTAGWPESGQAQEPTADPEPEPAGDVTETIDLSAPAEPAAGQDAGPAEGAGDTTEVIDLGGGTPAEAPPPLPAPTVITPETSASLRGWTRTGVAVNFERAGLYDDAPDPADVPFDRGVLRSQMLVRVRYTRGQSFEAVAEGFLEYGVFEEDSPSDVPWVGWNGQDRRTSFQALLREAYVGRFWRRFDLRLGQQRVAWGHSEFIKPNDVVNPRDTRDPLLAESELLNVPSLMARADIAVGETGSLQLLVQPFFVGDVTDVYGSNWSTVQPGAPLPIKALLQRVTPLFDPSLEDAVQPLLRQSDETETRFDTASAGARYAYRFGDLDVSHFYHYGYGGTPVLSIDPAFAQQLAAINWYTVTNEELAPVFAALQGGERPFESTYQRRHHVGSDVQLPVGAYVVRLDAALQTDAVLTRRDLTGLTRPVATAVLGFEKPPDRRRTFIVELIGQQVFDAPDAEELLGSAPTSVAAAVLWRVPIDDSFDFETRTLVGLTPFELISRTQLGWTQGALAFKAGVLILRGEDGTVADYFAQNTSAFLHGKYSF